MQSVTRITHLLAFLVPSLEMMPLSDIVFRLSQMDLDDMPVMC